MTYSEWLGVGYRHTDRLDPTHVNFPFGHGLSYTDFTIGEPVLTPGDLPAGGSYTLSVPVSNTGAREGAEVVQVYVAPQGSSVSRPEKELKGFDKVRVSPAETGTAEISLGPDAFAYYDADGHQWRVAPGEYELLVGTSAADILYRLPVRISDGITWSDAVK